MNYKYKLKEQEVIEAMELNSRGSKFTLIFFVVIGLLLVVVGFNSKYQIIYYCAAIGGVAGYLLSQKIYIPYRAKKTFREVKALQVEITMKINDKGVFFSSNAGSSNLDWESIFKWKSNNNICLLYISSNMFHMIPLRIFSTDDEKNSVFGIFSENIGSQKT